MAFKIAIVGGADSRKSAPFENQSWEIWAPNNCFTGLPRISRAFELHKIHFDGTNYYRRGRAEFRGIPVRDYLRELSKLNIPIYMQLEWPIVHRSIQYPLEDIIKRFGRYFTSSIAYMMALAIREGAIEIGLHGINMGMDDEYSIQKPCLEYLIGYARGMGIKVSIPEDSMLLYSQGLYGYEEILLPTTEELKEWANKSQIKK